MRNGVDGREYSPDPATAAHGHPPGADTWHNGTHGTHGTRLKIEILVLKFKILSL